MSDSTGGIKDASRREDALRDAIEIALRDAYAAGCNAIEGGRIRSYLTAAEYAHREAPRLRAAPNGWRCEVQKAIDRARMVDDGADSDAAEIAKSVINILSGLLSRALFDPPETCVAWIWFRPDGGYDGPIHDSQMSDIRRRSGVWTPLAPPPVSCERCSGWTAKLGVGRGGADGRLFVHGDYDSINAALARISAADSRMKEYSGDLQRVTIEPWKQGDAAADITYRLHYVFPTDPAKAERMRAAIIAAIEVQTEAEKAIDDPCAKCPEGVTCRTPKCRRLASTGTVADIPDAALLDRVMRNLPRRPRRQPAWARVGDMFALGSTYSKQLCARFGIDPDTGKPLEQRASEGKIHVE